MGIRTGQQYLDKLNAMTPARGDRRRGGQREDRRAPRVPQRGPLLRQALRHAARPAVPGRADLHLAQHRGPGQCLLPGAEDRRGPPAPAPRHLHLGRVLQRLPGPLRGLHELLAHRAQHGREVVRAGGPEVRREHPQLLRVGPGKRRPRHAHPDPAAGQPLGLRLRAARRPALGPDRGGARGRHRHPAARACSPPSPRSPTNCSSSRPRCCAAPRRTPPTLTPSPSPTTPRACATSAAPRCTTAAAPTTSRWPPATRKWTPSRSSTTSSCPTSASSCSATRSCATASTPKPAPARS